MEDLFVTLATRVKSRIFIALLMNIINAEVRLNLMCQLESNIPNRPVLIPKCRLQRSKVIWRQHTFNNSSQLSERS